MAKETKAERLIREQSEQTTERNVFITRYPHRLAWLMVNYANAPGFSIDFANRALDSYEFSYDSHWATWELPLMPNIITYNDLCDITQRLEEAEHAVEDYHDRVEAERLMYEARQAALAKLTPEDRNLLGLS